MTTIDQIKEAAIEAAMLEAAESGCPIQWHAMRDALDAYEAAMDRYFDDAPKDGSAVLAKHFHFGWIEVRYADRGVWMTRDGREITRVEHLTHFRPIPQPPVSAAIRAAGEE